MSNIRIDQGGIGGHIAAVKTANSGVLQDGTDIMTAYKQLVGDTEGQTSAAVAQLQIEVNKLVQLCHEATTQVCSAVVATGDAGTAIDKATAGLLA